MPGTAPGSEVLEFFNDANVFITGGTGFLGKALIDKFLRVFDNINHIYVLIRPKKGKEPQTRLKELFEDPLFNTLRNEKPGFEKRITCIFGDVSTERLGMSDNDYDFLSREVTHVIHSAATVRFNEKMKTALEINVLGAREISTFCTKCVRLKVFVHVSTAYAQTVRSVVCEELYDPPISGEKALKLLEIFTEEKLNSLTEELVKPWPNTYSFTKSIGENVVSEICKSIPTAIFRPGIVMGSMNEPVQGWIDNIYGPTGVIAAVGIGLMRVINANGSVIANVIPVDLTVNAILSCAWETGIQKMSTVENSLPDSTESVKRVETVPRVYNFVVDEDNSVTWMDFLKINRHYGLQSPSEKAVWYYTLTMTKLRFLYLLLIYPLHYVPAVLADTVCVLLGKKPQLIKAYQKIHYFLDSMLIYANVNWKFKNENIIKLWSRLNDTDKKLFYFNMSEINWESYLSGVILGIRTFIFKEHENTLPAAKRKMFFFWLCHRLLQICFALFWFWVITKCFFSLDSQVTPLKTLIPMSSEVFTNST